MGILYQLTFKSGKSYIGVSVNTLMDRMRRHRKALLREAKDSFLYRAWRKYGSPTARVLAIVEDRELPATEERAIQVLGTLAPAGYNTTPGGYFAPTRIPSVAAKISKALTGKRLSVEAKRKVVQALTGRPVSFETRKKISEATTGRVFSRLHLHRLGVASRKRWGKD